MGQNTTEITKLIDVSADHSEATELLASIRNGQTFAPVDLSNALLVDEDLSGLNLAGANLQGANLAGACLDGAILMGANLRDAVLIGASINHCEMSGADLENANLESCKGESVGLAGARLCGARMMNMQLRNSSLTGADMSQVVLDGSCLEESRLAKVCLKGASLLRCNLQRADLAGANVEGAIFTESDLRGATLRTVSGFEKACWLRTDMREINFAGAYLLRRFANDQNYLDEFRNRNRFSSAVYWLWLITSDCGRSLSRWGLLIFVQVILFACLYTQVGVDYGDHDTWLSPIYFSVVTITTLGYGDVLPTTVGGQIVTICEVVIGYIMLGGLLSIFTNKMARRAD